MQTISIHAQLDPSRRDRARRENGEIFEPISLAPRASKLKGDDMLQLLIVAMFPFTAQDVVDILVSCVSFYLSFSSSNST